MKELELLKIRRDQNLADKLNSKKEELIKLFAEVDERIGYIYPKDKKFILLNQLLYEYKEKIIKDAGKNFEEDYLKANVNFSNSARIEYNMSQYIKTQKQKVFKSLLDEQTEQYNITLHLNKEKEVNKNPSLYKIDRPCHSRLDFYNMRNTSTIFSVNTIDN